MIMLLRSPPLLLCQSAQNATKLSFRASRFGEPCSPLKTRTRTSALAAFPNARAAFSTPPMFGKPTSSTTGLSQPAMAPVDRAAAIATIIILRMSAPIFRPWRHETRLDLVPSLLDNLMHMRDSSFPVSGALADHFAKCGVVQVPHRIADPASRLEPIQTATNVIHTPCEQDRESHLPEWQADLVLVGHRQHIDANRTFDLVDLSVDLPGLRQPDDLAGVEVECATAAACRLAAEPCIDLVPLLRHDHQRDAGAFHWVVQVGEQLGHQFCAFHGVGALVERSLHSSTAGQGVE